MYIQPPLMETDPEGLHAFIRAHPFGTLIVAVDMGLDANHLPFELVEEKGELLLRGHVSKANPVWRQADGGIEALVLFQGPHGYISPSWHPARHTHGKIAPSWNYSAVHVEGVLRAERAPEWLKAHLTRLTLAQENSLKNPWSMAEAPEAFVEGSVKYIVGVELKIKTLKGKVLASQQYREADRQAIVQAMLDELGPERQPLADMMRAKTSLR